ncbi:hypothetical protein BP6252_05757 [Coleophoma cylindrospora]|uniref:Zn(2)-C6 fungal-type domain-containing protein n=1 Tax=Coleophoma cylindrospora TaxID=1849047 RepID=A0A3D8RV17_9HELO|nr:hypothetical protein BP6252_05757 [Coleophoma cylindrospora]
MTLTSSNDPTSSPPSAPAVLETAVSTDNNAVRKVKQRRIAADERRRAVRACDACRRVKEKCEGGVPCRRCTHFRRACKFDTQPSPRDAGVASRSSRGPNTYPRDLLDRSQYMERILRHKFPSISLETESLRHMAESLDGEDSATVNTGEDEDDFGIDDEICTIDPVEDTTIHYSGEFSYWNFSMRLKRQIDDRMIESNVQNQKSEQVPGYWRAEQLHSGSGDSLAAAISLCPPRAIADFLVQTFYNYAETHFFYVEREWLNEKINLLYQDPGNVSVKGSATVGIILTVFAIGTQYAYLDSRGQNGKASSEPRFSEDEVGKLFYQHAVRLLPEIIELSSLESVQACLLLGVYSLPIDASGLAFLYIGIALRLAIQNGMHRKYLGNSLSPTIIETRNRVMWTAYTLDRKICIFHGRPLSMAQSKLLLELPKDRGLARRIGEGWKLEHMCASIHLTHSLESSLDEICFLQECKKHEIVASLNKLISIKTERTTWWERLPRAGVDEDENYARFRSGMHLRLEYCLVRMFVGRPFLFGRDSTRSNFSSPSESSELQTNDATSGTSSAKKTRAFCRAALVEDCIKAAQDAIDSCRALRDNRGLARASYIEYSSCRASLLVLIAHSIQDQSDHYQTYLKDGLDMIRDMSTAGDSARSEVILLETLERAVARLHYNGTGKPGTKGSDNTSSSLASGYDHFKHWESILKSTGVVNPTDNGAQRGSGSSANTTSVKQPADYQTLDPDLFDWSPDDFNQLGTDPNFDMNCSSGAPFDAYHSTNNLTFFGMDNMDDMTSSTGKPTYNETEVLENFLADPGYRINFTDG